MASIGVYIQPTHSEILTRLQKMKDETADLRTQKSLSVIAGVLAKVEAATQIIGAKGSVEEKEQQKRRADQLYTNVERILNLVDKIRQAGGNQEEKAKIAGIITSNISEIKTIMEAMREVTGRLDKNGEHERSEITGIITGAALDTKAPAEVPQAAPTPAPAAIEAEISGQEAPVEAVEQKHEMTPEQMKAKIGQKFVEFVGADHFAFFVEGNRLKNELNSLDAASLNAVLEALLGGDVNRQYFTKIEKLSEETRLEAAKVALNLIKMLNENHGKVEEEKLRLALDYVEQEGTSTPQYWAQVGGQCWAKEIEILDALRKGAVSRNPDGKVRIAKA